MILLGDAQGGGVTALHRSCTDFCGHAHPSFTDVSRESVASVIRLRAHVLSDSWNTLVLSGLPEQRSEF